MKYPNIEKAVCEMAMANNRPGSLESLLEDLYEWLEADGGYTFDQLQALDAWLGTLSAEEIDTLVDGEESEMNAIAARGPDLGEEGSVSEFFNVIFDDVI